MPMSNPGHVPVIMHYMTGLTPASVLDVGVGIGTYGFLARLFLDVAEGELDSAGWKTCIEGVEIFEAYRNVIWPNFYDVVHIGDIRNLVAGLPQYDVILCNDVLEHFTQEEAQGLIGTLLKKCKVLLATTPSTEFPQDAWGGNEAEAHLCLLSRGDFPASTTVHPAGVTSLYVSWSDSAAGAEVARLAKSAPRISYPKPGLFARLSGRLRGLRRRLGA